VGNPLANQPQDATGAFRIECNNPTEETRVVRVCIGLREGSAGSSIESRRMSGGGGWVLPYQLYKDAARSQLWGEINGSGGHQQVLMKIPAKQKGMTVLPIYGRIPAGLQGTVPNNYESQYPYPGQIEFSYLSAANGQPEPVCQPGSTYPADTVQDFAVTATVAHRCEMVGHDALNFGSVTITGAQLPALTGAFKMGVACTWGTPYTIALDDGIYSPGPGKRRMRGNAGEIDYDIFQDQNQQTRWGSTPGGDTGQIMEPLTGDGTPQEYIGHGYVWPQTAPGVGNYTDRVTLTVEY